MTWRRVAEGAGLAVALALFIAMLVAFAWIILDLPDGAEMDGPAPLTMQDYEARMRAGIWPDEMADGHETYDAGDGGNREAE